MNRPIFVRDPEVRILGYGKEQMWKQIFIWRLSAARCFDLAL